MRRTALVISALVWFAVACDGGGDASPTATVAPSPTPVDTTAALCAVAGQAPVVAGNVASPELREISGLAVSRRQDGVIWAHNDSGDTGRVFAMSPAGEHLGAYELAGAQAVDWEDMAIGPGDDDGVDYLYLADIGDNAAQRPDVTVYRVPEPHVGEPAAPGESRSAPGAEALVLRYPDRPHDAETFMVDPVEGDLLIVTKEGDGRALVFRAPADITPGQEFTLKAAGQIDFSALRSAKTLPPDASPLVLGAGHLTTGGDVSPGGDAIAIRTYSTVWLWKREPGSPLAEAFAGQPCEGPSAVEAQGEAIAFEADGLGYITISEGVNPPVHTVRP